MTSVGITGRAGGEGLPYTEEGGLLTDKSV
jgi:hypothetical protein